MKKLKQGRYLSGPEQAKRFGYGMITPTLIVMAVMTAYPLIFTFYYSFTDYNLLQVLKSPAKFVGFGKFNAPKCHRNLLWLGQF